MVFLLYTSPMSDSYEYKDRKGVRPISWNDFYGLCKGLALAVADYKPDVIVGVARGGLYPATQLSHMLQAELFAIRLSRRLNDKIVHQDPVWIQRPTEYLKGKRVLVVDEICDTGQTLEMVKKELAKVGVTEMRTATLYAHQQSTDKVDYIGLISDELLLNPWDREIVADSEFVLHPEYVEALKYQTDTQAETYRLGVEAIKPDYVRLFTT